MKAKLTFSAIAIAFSLSHLDAQEAPMYFPAAAGDKISLFDDRLDQPTMYGFGIEHTNVLYYKSREYHRWYIGTNADEGASSIMDLSDSALFIDTSVGIGTTAPVTPLDIVNTVDSGEHFFTVRNHTTAADSSAGISFINSTYNQSIAGSRILSTRKNGSPFVDFNIQLYDGNSMKKRFTILGDTGNVGIGTNDPGMHRLAVNGSVRAKEVIVDTGWSDFVFEDSYRLRSLDEVESYIEEHGHLPDVPSAGIVESEGLSVGEAQKIMMQKIEELTLYMIEKDKQVAALQATVEAQQKEIENLKTN